MTRFDWLWRRTVLAIFLTGKALITPAAFGVNAVVEDEEGNVLVVRHSYLPHWHLPGGGVNPGEPPKKAIVRELEEEIGLLDYDPPELMGIFTRKLVWIGNVIALYRVRNAKFKFKRNVEVIEMKFVDPKNLPEGIAPGTKRRLLELANSTPASHYW